MLEAYITGTKDRFQLFEANMVAFSRAASSPLTKLVIDSSER